MTVIRAGDIEMTPLEGRRSGDPLSGIAAASSVRVVELEPGTTRTAHRHPYSEEVVVVARGSATVWIEGKSRPVSAGDVVHIPAGAAHATLAGEPTTLHCFFPHPDLAENMETTDIEVEEES